MVAEEAMMICPIGPRSSLELMLESIQLRDERLTDLPPALPVRPVSKARVPPARRGLPVNFQNGGFGKDIEEKEARRKEDGESNFILGAFGSERLKREDSVESSQEESVEDDDVTARVLTKEIESGDSVGFVLNKIELLDAMDDIGERALEGMLVIQKYFRGHQARRYYLELKGGAITLQSFIRGEKARKEYQLLTRRLAAVIVLQQHAKKWIEWRKMQKRLRAVIGLQSVIRGWLTRRCFNRNENVRLLGIEHMEDMSKLDLRDPETMDCIHTSSSALADLQRRLVWTERELGKKEDENAALRQQLQQLDKKWSQYEAKMKSIEKIWQDQLTSLQMGLAAAKSLACEGGTGQRGTFDHLPLYGADDTMSVETHDSIGRSAVDFSNLPCDVKPHHINTRSNDDNQLSERHKKVFRGNYDTVEVKSARLASIPSPHEEVRKLKFGFEAWKEDYKSRLQEITAMLQKLGQSEIKKSRKKWWRRFMQKGR